MNKPNIQNIPIRTPEGAAMREAILTGGKKVNTLLNFLRQQGIQADNILQRSPQEYELEDGSEYLILTDEEATARANDSIADSLWAFNADYLLSYINCEDPKAIEAFREMQGKLCESANPLCLAIIGGNERLPEFCRRAIEVDGRGHFMSTYDGVEHEYDEYYIYRIN